MDNILTIEKNEDLNKPINYIQVQKYNYSFKCTVKTNNRVPLNILTNKYFFSIEDSIEMNETKQLNFFTYNGMYEYLTHYFMNAKKKEKRKNGIPVIRVYSSTNPNTIFELNHIIIVNENLFGLLGYRKEGLKLLTHLTKEDLKKENLFLIDEKNIKLLTSIIRKNIEKLSARKNIYDDIAIKETMNSNIKTMEELEHYLKVINLEKML